ncbi:MAG: hypothetical protein AAB502_03960 [Chloroflexota bacterium]
MRDAVELEKKGIPTVTFVQDGFALAARAQAKMLGMAELPLVVVHYLNAMNQPWLTDEERHKMMEDHWGEIVGGLTKTPPQPAR